MRALLIVLRAGVSLITYVPPLATALPRLLLAGIPRGNLGLRPGRARQPTIREGPVEGVDSGRAGTMPLACQSERKLLLRKPARGHGEGGQHLSEWLKANVSENP